MLIVIIAVLVGVFFAATGRGGEMSYEPADHAPLDLGPVSAADVALLRPPTAMWGYNTQVTDEALEHVARAMRERDVKIARLEERLAILDPERSAAAPANARAVADPAGHPPEAAPLPGPRPASAAVGGPEDPTVPDSFWVPEPSPASEDFPEPDIIPFPDDSRAGDPPPLFPDEATRPPEPVPVFPDEAARPAEFAPVFPDEAARPAEPVPVFEDEAPGPPQAPPGADIPEAPDEPGIPPAPQTPLVLKAPAPPSLPGDQAPAEASAGYEVTQPAETYEAGPQGSFDTHGWWAEQKQAARDEAWHKAADRETGESAAQDRDR